MNSYKYEEIEIGHRETFCIVITKDMEDSFRMITGDMNPLHFDDEYASEVMGGVSHVAFGMLTASFLSTLAGVWLPGKYSLIHSVEVGFAKPVFVGDKLTITGEVADKKDELNLLCLKVVFKNQNNKTVLKANMKVVVLK